MMSYHDLLSKLFQITMTKMVHMIICDLTLLWLQFGYGQGKLGNLRHHVENKSTLTVPWRRSTSSWLPHLKACHSTLRLYKNLTFIL